MDETIEEKEKLLALEEAKVIQAQAESDKKRAEEERAREQRELLEQKQQREQEERERRERKPRELEATRKFDEEQKRKKDEQQPTTQTVLGLGKGDDSADTLRWKLVFLPWHAVRSLKQARFLTLVGTASLGAIAAFWMCFSIYVVYRGVTSSFTQSDWIGSGIIAIYFGYCAYGTFANSRAAACLGLFPIVLYFDVILTKTTEGSLSGIVFLNILLPIGFILAWILFSGVKGTFATARLQKKSNET
jgi:hypothetical protein